MRGFGNSFRKAFMQKAVVAALLSLPLFALSCNKSEGGDGRIDTGGPNTAAAGWMELPQDNCSGDVHWVRHYMTISGKRMRNWSAAYSYTDKISYWVAYPLNKGLKGPQSGRTNEWAYDPEVPTQYQYNVSSIFSGYDRGHQLPSADRNVNSEVNASTYYSTNMTPQNGGFNQHIWQVLEQDVRSWATASDTLYVLTGAVRGSKTSNGVNVPSAYFKALLRYSSAKTIGVDGYVGIGFWFDHAEYSSYSNYMKSITRDMAISLSDLEKLLGYELFPNLRMKIGARKADKVKNDDPSAQDWWWRGWPEY